MPTAPTLTGLPGNENYCMRLKGFTPSGVEADRHHVHGVVGVTSELRNLAGTSEFRFLVGAVGGISRRAGSL
jgi:hypothetical protein